MKALGSLSLHSLRGSTLSATTGAGAIGGRGVTGGGNGGATEGMVLDRTGGGAAICGGAAWPATDRDMVTSKVEDNVGPHGPKKPLTHPKNSSASTLMSVHDETREEVSNGRRTQPVRYHHVG